MRSQPVSPRRVNQRRDAAAMFKKGRLDENLHEVTGKVVHCPVGNSIGKVVLLAALDR